MDKPIPSYLLAIAVGDIAARATGPRSAVYAEPSVVDAAAKEFADTEKMIETTEKLYGPYRWGRYDMLVLPPSFPFGGMENPCMTFATPTVIVGDKSLVSLIAHELAHSWSGNLVTNAAWKHMWLNEGFTTYVENRIVEAVYGKAQADEEFILAADELRGELDETPKPDQRLVPNFDGRDPDDAGSDFAYTKGAWLLRTLEASYGRDVFDRVSARLLRPLRVPEHHDRPDARVSRREPDPQASGPHEPRRGESVDRQARHSGATRRCRSRRASRRSRLRAREWLAGKRSADALDAKSWNTQEWMYFLDGLPKKLSTAQLEQSRCGVSPDRRRERRDRAALVSRRDPQRLPAGARRDGGVHDAHRPALSRRAAVRGAREDAGRQGVRARRVREGEAGLSPDDAGEHREGAERRNPAIHRQRGLRCYIWLQIWG